MLNFGGCRSIFCTFASCTYLVSVDENGVETLLLNSRNLGNHEARCQVQEVFELVSGALDIVGSFLMKAYIMAGQPTRPRPGHVPPRNSRPYDQGLVTIWFALNKASLNPYFCGGLG